MTSIVPVCDNDIGNWKLLQSICMVNMPKNTIKCWKCLPLAQTQVRRHCAIHWYLCQWQVCCSPCNTQSATTSVCWHHGYFSDCSCIVLQTLQSTGFISERLGGHISDEINFGSHKQDAVEIDSIFDFRISQDSVPTNLMWNSNSLHHNHFTAPFHGPFLGPSGWASGRYTKKIPRRSARKKNFENQCTLSQVMTKSQVFWFYWDTAYKYDALCGEETIKQHCHCRWLKHVLCTTDVCQMCSSFSCTWMQRWQETTQRAVDAATTAERLAWNMQNNKLHFHILHKFHGAI